MESAAGHFQVVNSDSLVQAFDALAKLALNSLPKCFLISRLVDLPGPRQFNPRSLQFRVNAFSLFNKCWCESGIPQQSVSCAEIGIFEGVLTQVERLAFAR